MTKQQLKHRVSRGFSRVEKRVKKRHEQYKSKHHYGQLVKGHPSWNIKSVWRERWLLDENVENLCDECRWCIYSPSEGFHCNHEEGECYGERFEQGEP